MKRNGLVANECSTFFNPLSWFQARQVTLQKSRIIPIFVLGCANENKTYKFCRLLLHSPLHEVTDKNTKIS